MGFDLVRLAYKKRLGYRNTERVACEDTGRDERLLAKGEGIGRNQTWTNFDLRFLDFRTVKKDMSAVSAPTLWLLPYDSSSTRPHPLCNQSSLPCNFECPPLICTGWCHIKKHDISRDLTSSGARSLSLLAVLGNPMPSSCEQPWASLLMVRGVWLSDTPRQPPALFLLANRHPTSRNTGILMSRVLPSRAKLKLLNHRILS